MRFLKWFIVMMVAAVILPAVGWGMWVEASAWWEARELLQSYMRIQSLANEPLEEHGFKCKLENAVGSQKRSDGLGNIAGYQVRFVDRQKYVVELVCGTDLKTFIKLSEGDIGHGVDKYDGSGTFYPVFFRRTGEEDFSGGVKLRNKYRRVRVGFEEGKPGIRYASLDQPLLPEFAPPTTCEGWSGLCCDGQIQAGGGKQLPATDCPGNCFASCLRYPQVTSFYLERSDEGEGEVVVGSGSQVRFYYDVTDIDGVLTDVRLDFGDGSREAALIEANSADPDVRPRSLVSGSGEHRYKCSFEYCEFWAKVGAVDNDGLSNLDLTENRIRIIVVGPGE